MKRFSPLLTCLLLGFTLPSHAQEVRVGYGIARSRDNDLRISTLTYDLRRTPDRSTKLAFYTVWMDDQEAGGNIGGGFSGGGGSTFNPKELALLSGAGLELRRYQGPLYAGLGLGNYRTDLKNGALTNRLGGKIFVGYEHRKAFTELSLTAPGHSGAETLSLTVGGRLLGTPRPVLTGWRVLVGQTKGGYDLQNYTEICVQRSLRTTPAVSYLAYTEAMQTTGKTLDSLDPLRSAVGAGLMAERRVGAFSLRVGAGVYGVRSQEQGVGVLGGTRLAVGWESGGLMLEALYRSLGPGRDFSGFLIGMHL